MAFREQEPGLLVSDRAKIAEDVKFGRNIRIWANVEIGEGTTIFDNVELGSPGPGQIETARRAPCNGLDALDDAITDQTTIGRQATIRSNVQIYTGCSIGDYLDCAHFVNVREGCIIGSHVYIKVQAEIRREVSIGNHCTVGGLLGDRSKLGNGVTSFGNLVHASRTGLRGHVEAAPELERGVFVGRNATIIGGVRIGTQAYVAAGAIVTSDIPAHALVRAEKARILLGQSPLVDIESNP